MKKIALVLALVVVAAAAGGLYYLKSSKNIVLDSAAVEAEAAEILPGARPPKGMQGVLAISPKEDLRIVVFAPSLPKAKPANLSGDDLRIAIVKPKTADPNIQEIRAKLDKVQEMRRGEMDILSESPTLLTVAKKPYPGLASEVSLKDTGAKQKENLTVFMRDKQPVIVLIVGPAESFNTAARDEFFEGLEAPELTKKLPGGLRMPDKNALPDTPPEGKPEPPGQQVAPGLEPEGKVPPGRLQRPKRPRKGPPKPPFGK